MNIEHTIIKIPGVKKEYRFLQISDVHIAYADDNECAENKAVAQEKTKTWSPVGMTPIESWEVMADYVNEMKDSFDALFISGDCLDYFSLSSCEFLKHKMEQIPIEILYTPGNHELMVRTSDQPCIGQLYHEYYDSIMLGNADFWVRDYTDFLVIGINNGARVITQVQLDMFKEQMKRNIPIVLLMHIPIQTDAVLDAIERRCGKRNMYFVFEPNDKSSEEFCHIIRKEESNVVAILAGHIHAAHHGEFAPGRIQYTTAPLHEKYMRMITIAPC